MVCCLELSLKRKRYKVQVTLFGSTIKNSDQFISVSLQCHSKSIIFWFHSLWAWIILNKPPNIFHNLKILLIIIVLPLYYLTKTIHLVLVIFLYKSITLGSQSLAVTSLSISFVNSFLIFPYWHFWYMKIGTTLKEY